MVHSAPTTKDRLTQAAALLFRQRGYHGVGLNDLLAAANAPKGSLYHHFPHGKADLAIAAASWASDEMLQIIDASFEDANTFRDGATTLCHKLAKLFDVTGKWDGCPVSSTLFEGPDNDAFRDHMMQLFNGWIKSVEAHACALGLQPDEARHHADHLFILIQGGWILARARHDSDILRGLPKML